MPAQQRPLAAHQRQHAGQWIVGALQQSRMPVGALEQLRQHLDPVALRHRGQVG
jgi:hypothetical protein